MTQSPSTLNDLPWFEDPPDAQLLQWLARGSLKQNLLRAIRLWVWLCTLYGPERNSREGQTTDYRLNLPDLFTYKDWRDAFFTPSHPKGDTPPTLHDPACPCAKTVDNWLFTAQIGLSEAVWIPTILQQSGLSPSDLETILHTRLFAVTRRSLASDLKTLAELGWLKEEVGAYTRVDRLPRRPGSSDDTLVANTLGDYDFGFLTSPIEAIAHHLSQPVAGEQRFFLEVDYIIAQDQHRVEKHLETLKAIWEEQTVSPLRLTYRSAKHDSVCCIVYPVCIYYVQRAIYLCAFGETPSTQGDWYNYRLDKVQQIQPLAWTVSNLPTSLKKRRRTPPTPYYIQSELNKAWGFDFYLPAQLMVLRFERLFHDRYIQNTFRHKTFQPISYQDAVALIQTCASLDQKKALLQVIQSRSPHDAYYKVYYRDGDTNVGLRLRSWRPKVEVLCPWSLRQEMLNEIQAETQFYTV